MPVSPDTKSYPFLAIAERFGVDHGHVLCYADAIKKTRRNQSMNYWETEAACVIHGRKDGYQIIEAIKEKVVES